LLRNQVSTKEHLSQPTAEEDTLADTAIIFLLKQNLELSGAQIEKGIINFADSVDADLIGMCTHGRTGLAHFFNGSISEDIVNHTVKPIITFKI
jgi:nucleotide-binding universal stress UspA family protein